MKKISLLFLSCVFNALWSASAQDVRWLNSTPSNYNMNPEMPLQPACISGTDIYSARLIDFALSFGQDILGSMSIDHLDTSGALLWSFSLESKLTVTGIHADAGGNVFVAGMFMETLHLNGTDSLVNTGTGVTTNLFLLCLNSSGSLVWKRNVSIGAPDALVISSLDADAQNRCWYGISFFDSAQIVRLDPAGNDVQFYSIHGIRLLSSFSFDPNDNLYLAGSAGLPSMNVNGMTAAISEPYVLFVSRIAVNGTTSWIELAHDQTFQDPHIVATATGDAYVGASLLDSTAFGNVIFEGPQWVYDIFIARVDSVGDFSWGIEVPETPNIVGDFQRGKKNFFDVDNDGNLYLTGKVRGSVDWGNGVVTTTGVVQTYGASIISFDPNGVARWQITGSTAGSATPYSLCAGAPDECYFSCSVVDTATFGNFQVNQNGGFALLIGKISSGSSLGLPELASSSSLVVFPNPADRFIGLGDNVNYSSLSVFNAIGERLMFRTDAQRLLDISSLQPGVYFLKAMEKNKVFVGRFVKL